MDTKKQLKKAYTKRLDYLNKHFFECSNSGLNIFIEHLKYKRDNLVLSNSNEASLASLASAIAEFEAYQTSEENKQKEFHWTNFCGFLKLYMEEWQTLNDSV
jgi:hypothetical protein